MIEILRRNRMGALSIIALLLVLSMAWFAARLEFRPLDWQNYLAAARAVAAGGSPYRGVEFFAPPWVALMLVPFSWLPPDFSAGLWLLGSLMAVMAMAALWIDYAGYPKRQSSRLLAVVGAVFCPVALYVYVTGQISALAGLALVYLVVASRRPNSRYWLMAVAALVASAKPHIVGIPLLLLLVDDLRRGERRLTTVVALSLGAAALISLVVLPGWPREWWAALSEADYLGGAGLVAAGYLGFRELGAPGLVLLFPLLYGAYRWYRHGPEPEAVSLSLAGTLVWIPYARTYDQIVLWPAVLTAVAAWRQSRFRWALALPLLSFYLLPLTDLALLTPVVLFGLLLPGLRRPD